MIKTFNEFINEGIVGNIGKRSLGKLQRKEDIIPIKYHPQTRQELKQIIQDEINYQGGKYIDLTMIDISKITDLSNLFNNCRDIISLNLSNWNTEYVEDMSDLFNNCLSLEDIKISNWNTKNVKSMIRMFAVCEKLNNLDLSKWKVKKLQYTNYMFYGCGLLSSLDLDTWKSLPNLIDYKGMFDGCPCGYEIKDFKIKKI